MNNNSSTITVQHKLGQGKFSVYYIDCPANNTGYALKIFPKQTPNGTLQYHKERVVARLDHPNIIQYVHIQCNTPDFDGLVTEYAPFGDLFEWMLSGYMENEMIIRSYFHQMIEAVEYLHGQNIAHLDLKLENMMIGNDFKLKIIDFDQAQSLKDGWVTSGGTKCYRAPEIMTETCSDFTLADIYSVGVTLYALATKEFPFLEGGDRDNGYISPQYRVFLEDNKRFWGCKRRLLKGRKGGICEEFIELINGMLERDVTKRWNVKEIKESRWYNGPVLDCEGLKSEMSIIWEMKNKKRAKSSKKNFEMELE